MSNLDFASSSQSANALAASETSEENPDDPKQSSAIVYVHDTVSGDQQNEQGQQQQPQRQQQKQKANRKFGKNCRPGHCSAIRRKLAPSKCDICNNSFASPRGVFVHKHRKHGARRGRLSADGPNVFSCLFCNYTTKNVSTLKKHERVHKPYTPIAHRLRPRSVASPMVGQQNAVCCPSPSPADSHRNGKAKVTPPTNAKKKRKRQTPLNTNGQQNIGGSNLEQRPAATNAHDGGGQNDGDPVKVDEETDDDIVVIECKPNVGQRQNGVGTSTSDASANVSHCVGTVISACAQGNLVAFHDVSTVRGAIGKITFQFMCNTCRGERGVARCFRGRAQCVMCCGHSECD